MNFSVELSKGRPSETKGVGGCDEAVGMTKGVGSGNPLMPAS